MRKSISRRCLVFSGMLLAGLAISAPPNRAQARKQYSVAFPKKYPRLKAKFNAVKCNACHVGKAKKNRNDYGQALARHLKNRPRNAQAINKAFEKAEKEKNAKGDTFGSLINAGKLPGTKP